MAESAPVLSRPLNWNKAKRAISQTTGASVVQLINGIKVTSGEAFALHDALYAAADGKVYKAIATDDAKDRVTFLAMQAATAAGQQVTVALPGIAITDMAALTPGPYYLSDAVAGSYSTTSPEDDDEAVTEVGIAINATTFVFYPRRLIDL